MEQENMNQNIVGASVKKKSNILLVAGLSVAVLAIIICAYFLLASKDDNESSDSVVETVLPTAEEGRVSSTATENAKTTSSATTVANKVAIDKEIIGLDQDASAISDADLGDNTLGDSAVGL